MSSTRLPGKTLMDLGGKSVMERVIGRARRANLADEVVVATTTDSTDDELVSALDLAGTPWIRGSLDDVLARYVQAAKTFGAETIVRVTCDCPFIDPDVIDQAILAYREVPEVDYCANTLVRTYPIGMDAEVFSREALERAHIEATQRHEREHVTPYIYQHPEAFRLRNVEAPEWARWPNLRLTVDEIEDLQMLQKVASFVSAEFNLREILSVIQAHPEIVQGNAAVVHRHVDKPDAW